MKKVVGWPGSQFYVAKFARGEDEGGEGMLVPLKLSSMLNKFVDMLSKKLLKSIPPRRMINHQIELEPGSRSMVKAP